MKLFCNELCPKNRAVLLTVRALGVVDLQVEEVLVYENKEQTNEHLLEINPEYSTPTLIDGAFISWDSQSIVQYLAKTYGDSSLYPVEMKEEIDEKIRCDTEILYPRVDSVIKATVVENEKEIPTEKISAITDAYKLMNTYLENKLYLLGEQLTIADLCCVATISTATVITPISTEKYPNLSAWYKTCKNLPYYETANAVGLNKLDALVEMKLGRPTSKEFCDL